MGLFARFMGLPTISRLLQQLRHVLVDNLFLKKVSHDCNPVI